MEIDESSNCRTCELKSAQRSCRVVSSTIRQFSTRQLVDGLQFFAGLEANGLAGRNADLCAGARVAADAGLARTHVEDAEAAKFDAVALGERFLHGLEDGLNGHLGFCLGDAGLGHHFVDDVELDHVRSYGFEVIAVEQLGPKLST